jgi:hypothetical protein
MSVMIRSIRPAAVDQTACACGAFLACRTV